LLFDAAEEADVGLIVLRGAGGHFGAGNDITQLARLRGDPLAAKAYGRAMADAMRAVETATKPVIIAIEGACYGASVALALAGDFRVAADTAEFAITPAKLGALYLRSDLHRLVAAVGPAQGFRMIYTAQPVGAAAAERMGLVQQVHAADRFEAELSTLTGAILSNSPFTLRESKRLLRATAFGLAPPEDDESLGGFVEATQGADFGEGIKAFMARRRPQFQSG
jgi:enoyl-CoA hydratase/carnithine racemase